MLHYRLVVPIYRALHEKDITIRGVTVGIFIAMTPLVGIQMSIVLAVWFLQKLLLPKWRFNVIIAIAWTWTTNVFTAPPLYYIYILTGNLMLGRGIIRQDFGEFTSHLTELFQDDSATSYSPIIEATSLIYDRWGTPLLLGSVPWTLLVTWLAYLWIKKLMNRHHH